VGGELLGYLVITDTGRLVRELLPASASTPTTAETGLARLLGLNPEIVEVIDWSRGGAVGLLNPSLLAQGSVRPYVAMIPIKSRDAVEKLLARHTSAMTLQPWGLVVPSDQGTVYIGLERGYAIVAWRADLLEPARRVLWPQIAGRSTQPVRLHVNVENVYGAFRPQLELVLAHLGQLERAGGAAGDPLVALSMRRLEEVTARAGSLQALEIGGDLDSGGLTVSVRLDGKPGGAWAQLVAEERPGPAWGTQFLPADAVLAYATRSSPSARAGDVRAEVAYLTQADPAKKPSAGDVERWRQALHRAAGVTDGALAYAVWPGRHGGVGVGGAYRVSDPAMARGAVMATYDALRDQLGTIAARALVIDPGRFATGLSATRRQAWVANQPVDLVELKPRWPAGADAERRLFGAMFGPRLTLATAFVGDQALFAMGEDWEPRLAAMISTATGLRAASLADEGAFAEAIAFRPGARVALSWLETGRMARLAAGLLKGAQDLSPAQEQAVARLLEQLRGGAIVTTMSATGRRYEITTHLPSSALLGATRLSGALWRIALSPLLNPPLVPPLPVTPPHVAPSAGTALEAAPSTM
jgi:hypothetical protein